MTRTLLAVHAHPDDESTPTGGILAHYASLGARIVLVTCTNGELGDAPDGAKPFTPAHDPARVASHRLGELQAACRVLGVTDVELLGYHDSGLATWEKPPGAFVDVPVSVAAEKVARLIEHYEPQVVFAEALGVEDFVRARDTTGSPVPETDLFAGLGQQRRHARPASTAMTASGCSRRSCQLTQQSDCSVAISAPQPAQTRFGPSRPSSRQHPLSRRRSE